MKLYIYIIFCLFNLPAIAQDCKSFEQGTFELKGDFGTLIIERKGNWQLEKSIEYKMVYLNSIESVDNCKFIIRYHKVIIKGIVPEPDMSTSTMVEILKTEGEFFYFKGTLIGTEMHMEGYYKKLSDEISDEFKEIIAKEGQSSD